MFLDLSRVFMLFERGSSHSSNGRPAQKNSLNLYSRIFVLIDDLGIEQTEAQHSELARNKALILVTVPIANSQFWLNLSKIFLH
jgi:hypothetical protein